MPEYSSPEVVVQRQLDAYNRKDVDAWLACYAEDAQQRSLDGSLLAQGHAEIRARTAPRFAEPDLYARLLRREVFGHVVVDHEDVTRTLPEGKAQIEIVCVYLVERGLIQHAAFAIGPTTYSGRTVF
jgi:hypothetical protein